MKNGMSLNQNTFYSFHKWQQQKKNGNLIYTIMKIVFLFLCNYWLLRIGSKMPIIKTKLFGQILLSKSPMQDTFWTPTNFEST